MRATARLLPAGLLLLLLAAPAPAQYPGRTRTPGAGQPAAPRNATPSDEAESSLPAVRLGALLPLSGAGAWFGKEMRQGMELAIGELNPAGRPDASKRRADGTLDERARPEKPVTPPEPAGEEARPSPGVRLTLEAADVPPLDVKRAAAEFNRLAALGMPVVFTASVTPTLAIQPLAAARDVLVVHGGVMTGRLPAASRTLLHTRPSVAARVEALLEHAAGQKLRRLALLTAGDEFGKAVRAAAAARGRAGGGSLVLEESLTLDAPDLPARIRRLGRVAPEAVVLGFRGADLGDLAARLREGGYAGPLYLLDDDPAVRLAGGPALDGAVVVSDAFVPEAGSPGERFADGYKKRFGGAPSRHAVQAYDAVMMLAAGIAAAAAEGRPAPGGARLRDALLAARSFPSVAGGRVVLRDDGTLARPLALFTVEAGELAFVRHLAPPGPS